MSKSKTVFVCSDCGYETLKWMGKCPSCHTFNTMVEEEKAPLTATRDNRPAFGQTGRAAPLTEYCEDLSEDRVSTGMSELDRVFGGGLVKGSVTLLGGDPGIGKSTLLLQICQSLGAKAKVLYVSGEESRRQIKMRADRLSVTTDNLLLLTDTELSSTCHVIAKELPQIVIIDSIQTMRSAELNSLPGTISQIRECANSLISLAKAGEITFIFIGHINKEGMVAGPKMLEHMVDTVLYFEGDKNLTYRVIRATKNRFGSTNEIGIFEMTENGLNEVINPSAALLSGRPVNVSGTCTVCVLEGSRPILAEVQALLADSPLASPRRMANGIDYNRFSMLLAVLEKRAGLRISGCDAYLNVVGGLRLVEPSSDLAAIISIASSFLDKPVKNDIVAFGEVGLVGELRSVRGIDDRINEAVRLGYTSFIVPHGYKPKKAADLKIYGVKNISEAIEIALN